MQTRRAFLASAAAAAATVLRAEPTPHRDTIHLDRECQLIENFGASDCWSIQRVGGWSAENRSRVADLLFSTTRGIGLSCWRFNIGGGINSRITNPWRTAETFETAEGQYDWARQKNERWFLAAAKARGVPQFLAFANSPPGRMTRNGLTFCDNDSSTTNLKPGFEPQYARYLADVLEHFHTREGITFDYVSPINEPQWDWSGHSQEGNRADNAAIQSVTRSLYSEIQRRRLPGEIALVESGSIPDMSQLNRKATDRYRAPYGDYVNRLVGDPSFRGLLSGRIGYHAYGSDRLAGKLVEDRETLARTMSSYPGWKLWQTEYCVMDGPEGRGGGGRDLTMTTALDVARAMHVDLAVAGVSAWQWWLAVSDADYKDGLVYTDWKRPGDAENIIPSRLLWTFGHYSRFIRPGMRRIELAGDRHDIRGLLGSAYKDPAGRQVVAVYLNMSAEGRQVSPQFFHRAQLLHPSKLAVYITSDRPGDELKPYPAAAVLDIPARSAVTLVASL